MAGSQSVKKMNEALQGSVWDRCSIYLLMVSMKKFTKMKGNLEITWDRLFIALKDKEH